MMAAVGRRRREVGGARESNRMNKAIANPTASHKLLYNGFESLRPLQ